MAKLINYFKKEELGSIQRPEVTFYLPTRPEKLKLADLNVDPENYQRDFKKLRSKDIATLFEQDIAKRPIVGRRADKSLWIINGQHTCGGYLFLGEVEIVCDVVIEVTTPDSERRIFEAVNKIQAAQTAKLTLYNSYKNNDPDTVKAVNIVRSYGFEAEKDSRAVNNFEGGIVVIKKVYDKDNGVLLNKLMKFMHDTWVFDIPHQNANMKSLTSYLFLSGISDFFLKHGSHFDDTKKYKRFKKLCDANSPGILLQKRKEHSQKLYTILLRLYNGKLADTDPNYIKEVW